MTQIRGIDFTKHHYFRDYKSTRNNKSADYYFKTSLSVNLLISFIVCLLASLLLSTLDIVVKETIISTESLILGSRKEVDRDISPLLQNTETYIIRRRTFQFDPTDDYSARAIGILDVESNEIIFSKNISSQMLIASLTKIITTKVIYDNFDLDEIIDLDEVSASYDGSYLVLPSNTRFAVRDVIKASLVASNNQLMYAVNNKKNLVEISNRYIKALGLKNTKISNPVGYDEPGNYSSVEDLLVLAKVFFENDYLLDVSSMKKTEITELNSQRRITIVNTNDLKKNNNDLVIAGKTGTTPLAGQNLCLLVTKNGRKYLIVIVNSKERYNDALKIIDRL